MKLESLTIICFLLSVIAFVGCQHQPNSSDYLGLRKHLLENGMYKEFVGFQILPRDEDEYLVDLSNPKVGLAATLVSDDSVELYPGDERYLLDSLYKYYPTTAREREVSILKKVAKLMSFMQRESIWGVRGSFGRDTTRCTVEFFLTPHKNSAV